MAVLNAQADGTVCDDDVRIALERMAASEAFRGSPQLIAFLRYVVEATLRGQADRIKGYTIAVEALGRTSDFDPQTDPIVRVEATRLRRALSRYHAAVADPGGVIIDLPLGSYVPVFRRATAPVVVPLPAPVPAPRANWRSHLARARLNWRHALAGAALVLLGAGGYAALDFAFDFNTPNTQQVQLASAEQPSVLPASPRVLTALPAVFVGPFAATGDANARTTADLIRAKLRDALARFDEINVLSGPPQESLRARPAADSATAGQYRLTASVEVSGAGISVDVCLTDIADGRIVFARTFQSRGAGEGTLVRNIAAALAQPYGIIQSRERVHQIGTASGNPHYRCLLEAYDYYRSYDTVQHAHVRDCLERATEADPGFGVGFSMLAEIILQEHRRGLNRRPGDAPPLERALRAARRACELRPGGAGAHQALMDVHFFRGEYALARAAGEKAVQLNPYNPIILALYGARLMALGERDEGARFLNEAAASIVVRPAWMDFHLFLAAYLADDRGEAAIQAAQITSETFPLGLVAQVLVAAQRGNAEAARQSIDRLVALQPGWREDPRRELKKMFPSDAVAGRLAHDLASAGLGATN